MNQGDLIYWIWLSECVGQATNDFRVLHDLYEDPYDIYSASAAELENVEPLSDRVRQALNEKSLKQASEIYDTCERLGIRILPFGTPGYPHRLREIHKPPVLLYFAGTLPDFDHQFSVGMVGTRRMSVYGMDRAYQISHELASAGAMIVSGLAEGIDGVCAVAALEAQGKTAAVVGCGLDIAYPKHHGKLMESIARQGGVVISEYPPGTKPSPYHFPVRNRIISALSDCVIVVEAGVGSGSLITANEAVKQEKTVYAVPPNKQGKDAEGMNGLLREGASLLLDVDDILKKYAYVYVGGVHPERVRRIREGADRKALEKMGVIGNGSAANDKPLPDETVAIPRDPASAPKRQPESGQANKTEPDRPQPIRGTGAKPSVKEGKKTVPEEILRSLSPIQKAILEFLPDDTPISTEQLHRLEYPFGEVLAAITVLEIMGLVRKLPGSMYGKC